MLTEHSDEKLVELSVSEDPEAFGEIVKRWERKIFALCFGMLGREDEASDAAQETFIAAYRNLSNFRGEARVSSWLHRIAVNQCLTTKRRKRTRAEEFIDDDDGSAENTFVASPLYMPSVETEKAERLVIIRQAV